MPHTPVIYATAGTSAGFTTGALMEFLRRVDWPSFLAFVGSVVATGIGWYQAARAAKREQDRLDREMARDAHIADLVTELQAQKLRVIAESKEAA